MDGGTVISSYGQPAINNGNAGSIGGTVTITGGQITAHNTNGINNNGQLTMSNANITGNGGSWPVFWNNTQGVVQILSGSITASGGGSAINNVVPGQVTVNRTNTSIVGAITGGVISVW